MARKSGPIVLLTDFGYRDHYVGVMHGVVASIAPDAPVIDLTHGIAPQNVSGGALLLAESWRFFPPTTIFVVVIDPGVGTARRAIAIRSRAGARFVGPDNGVLMLAAEQAAVKRAVALGTNRYLPAPTSSTFHGRDIFSRAGAHLWNGVSLSKLGSEATDLVQLDLASAGERDGMLVGKVIHVDHFGNLITNLTRAQIDAVKARFPGKALLVTIPAGDPIKLHQTYGDAPEGAALALFGSFERLEIAVRDGSAASSYDAGIGTEVRVKTHP